ncbi:MAG: HAD-IIIA family hydrolase [Bacteroidetes bacterium]|jgi:3-deoxy-D-manno-octulosonate 8-phosphate phosphatase (KDO 8-P phosphatase)|nr:HAD-IIIA family hydrolase [Bacteroidota bacterium]
MTTPRQKKARLRRIKLLLLDVDGVMSDGGVYYSTSGEELKKFNTQDGYGIMKLQRAGVKIGIITGRLSKVVEQRAAELGITEVHQNMHDKGKAYDDICRKHGLTDAEVAYIGDDDPDLPVLMRVGFSAAPKDAVPAVVKSVHYVCRRTGGHGAVREVIDLILAHQNRG